MITMSLIVWSVLSAMVQVATPSASPVEGLWAYTELQPKGQKAFALTGMFVFHDGLFVQQTINDGEPFSGQTGQGHCGTYRTKGPLVEMTAEIAIGVSPNRPTPLSLRRNTEHQITPVLEGNDLTLTFGSGTIQKFRRAGPAKGTIYRLEGGMLALVDGHFLLVVASGGQNVVAGSGTFEQRATTLNLQARRWFSVLSDKATNMRDTTIKATFDEKTLTLGDGSVFKVLR
jgi:hypothetical protein